MNTNNFNQTNGLVVDEQCNHVQMGGMAFFDAPNYFMFSPDEPVPGSVMRFRVTGIAQQMTDGTFDFVAKPRERPKSTLILKLAHGRASVTKDGAIQLTLKVFKHEQINISDAMSRESFEAIEAIRNYQLKH